MVCAHASKFLLKAVELKRWRMDDPLEGCRWRALPHDFPPWDTVYDHWRRWQKRGVWPEAVAVLGIRWGEGALGRGRRALRRAILDRQSVQDRRRGRETWPARKARESKAARATGPSTARTRCWPCTSARRTRPTVPRRVPSWSRLASGILPSRASPPTPLTSGTPNTSPAKCSAWNSKNHRQAQEAQNRAGAASKRGAAANPSPFAG